MVDIRRMRTERREGGRPAAFRVPRSEGPVNHQTISATPLCLQLNTFGHRLHSSITEVSFQSPKCKLSTAAKMKQIRG